MITALGGGVGASKFIKGLSGVVSPKDITVVINTGDDINLYGFRISPDVDTIIYRLSDKVDKEKGWGLRNDSFNCLQHLSELGFETWFQLGDKDIAVQMFKKGLLSRGYSTRQITARTAELFGLKGTTLLPMTEDDVETWIETDQGDMHFQEYYIKHNMEPAVFGIKIKGIDKAHPCKGVIEAIYRSKLVILCPSNPVISIGPILAVKGIRKALVSCDAQVIAISPLVGGKPVKGPTDRLMKGIGIEVSSYEIANLYKDFLDLMVLDNSEGKEEERISRLGVRSYVTDTLMNDDVKSVSLSENIIRHVNY